MTAPYVFNVQKYSIHDGKGIRTTLFFKGCPLTCLWCHNPESQRFQKELMLYYNRCVNCGRCTTTCPQNANSMVEGKLVIDREKCNACGNCVDKCVYNAREVIGKEYTVDELVKIVEKDRMFYEESDGGVTLSGGEVMSQDINYLTLLCQKLHKKGISINIDTCGFAPFEKFEKLLPYVDTFLYDIKAMDNEIHKKYIGTENGLILENLIKLSEAGANINIRVPVIEKVNDTDEFFNDLFDFLKNNKIRYTAINLLPYHDISKAKYQNLDRTYEEDQMQVPSKNRMELFKDKLIENGFINIKIGG